jgi:hypothetical protein
MTNILKLQGLAVEQGGDFGGLLGHSDQSNNCGNTNSSASIACPTPK